jgi:hypothetical protein
MMLGVLMAMLVVVDRQMLKPVAEIGRDGKVWIFLCCDDGMNTALH